MEKFLKDRAATKSILEPLTSHSSGLRFHLWLHFTFMWDAEFVKRGGTEAIQFLE